MAFITMPGSFTPLFFLLLLLLLLLAAPPAAHADVNDDYRFLPTPKGGGQDVSYFVNAACRSGTRSYVGGTFNLVGDEVAFNFGYFDTASGNWTSPPITIGPDPMGLLYNDEALRSSDSQGKVLALLCPPPLPDGSTVVIIGGDFAKGGLRLGGAGGIPFVGPDGPRVLNHLAIYRVEPDAVVDSEASNLCPVVQYTLPPSVPSVPSATKPEDQYAKVRCSPPGSLPSPFQPGVVLADDPYKKLTGPPEPSSRAYVSSLACLNEACTDLVVGGSFNSILGTTAYSVARLRFDDHFYAAESLPVHDVADEPEDESSCLPSRAMGSFLDPLPGVDGAVYALAPIGSRYVAIGGNFARAGAVNSPNLVLWDRVLNSVVCLGPEAEQGKACFSPDFCCQGFPGDVRVALAVSSHGLLVGGSFADASSPFGTVSANLALVDFALTGDQVLDVKSWRRVPIADQATSRDVGTNGPVTSALCLDEEEEEEAQPRCLRVLVGGWFDGLEGFDWESRKNGDLATLVAVNVTSWGLMPFPLATLDLPRPSPNDVNAPAFLHALHVSVENQTSSDDDPAGVWARPVVGVNVLVNVPSANASLRGGVSILAGGKITDLGNVALLVQSGLVPGRQGQEEEVVEARSLIRMTHPDGSAEGPLCWEDETESLRRAEVLGLPVAGHGASMGFCCFVGSLCPFEGVAVNCPFDGGYFCLPNMTRPTCCAEGHYCPGPGVVALCDEGQYCPVGSTAMVPCAWWMWCRKPGLQRPDKMAAGVVALILVFSAFLVLAATNKAFLRCRAYYRQVRDNDRRKRGLLTSRGTHNHELQEPLLPQTDSKPLAKGTSTASSSSSSNAAALGPTKQRTPQRAAGKRGGGAEDGGPSTRVSAGGRSGAGPVLRQRHKVDRIDLQFRELSVELPGGRKKVLNNVTGGFRSGRVTAVMGPSGCGKTTLISALSNRLGLGTRVTGTTFINGSPESSTALHDVMGFVPQDDIMYEDLTVKENLLYCCQLRADPSMSRLEQRQHVDRVIDSLGLFPSRHSMIGSTEDRGISGGQRKRVNVGMELTSKPLVLFLDEPTSGLDSTTSAELMQYLHRLTATGLTIAAVIHQPRIEVFLGVDDVIFLGRGGRVAYYGAATDAVQYFSEQGFAFDPMVNPADRILDIITKADDSLYEAWQAHSQAAAAALPPSAQQGHFGYWVPKEEGHATLLPDNGGGEKRRPSTGGSGGGPYASMEGRRSPLMQQPALVYEEQLPQRQYPAFHSQAWSCLCRSLVQQHNNIAVAQQDLVMLMVFGLLVGLFDLGMKQYELSVLCMGLTSTLTGVRFFSAERVVFWRECSAGISIPAYYLGKVLSALPCTTLYPLAYLSFYYNMGFPRVSFAFYYLVLLWAAWVCFGVGVIMSLLLEPKNAQIGGVVIALVGFLFGGHTPNVETLEKTMPGKVGMWLSYVRWAIGALLLQDASLAPQCGALEAVGGLASEGFVSKSLVQAALPQNFQARVVDTEVAHCQQMLINICILYLCTAMILMWLSGRYRARMIGWAYFKVGLKQSRARLRDRFYNFLQRHQSWLPRWIINLALARQRGGRGEEKYEGLEDEDGYDYYEYEEDVYEEEGEEEEDLLPARPYEQNPTVGLRDAASGARVVPASSGSSSFGPPPPPPTPPPLPVNRGGAPDEEQDLV